MNGKNTKRIAFTTSPGQQAFDLDCVFSKLVKGTGSCILVLQAGPHLKTDPSHSRAQFSLTTSDAERLSKEFKMPTSGTQVYRSSDGLLNIGAARNPSGTVETFVLTYGN